eukprot:CAMPEP_0175607564 /NCGR_PEP_ID=MMETSP0096-20121207/61295_1 /TAXON_ID=311494 /ORGANISM="Alexandrium monilatum, Strain CCMP3105" /LENGTH=54 /DNA_ID=CAMNT_0016912427 /DNA_START=18 /DNA_END=178 /DNA_ORIENTATION=+
MTVVCAPGVLGAGQAGPAADDVGLGAGLPLPAPASARSLGPGGSAFRQAAGAAG